MQMSTQETLEEHVGRALDASRWVGERLVKGLKPQRAASWRDNGDV